MSDYDAGYYNGRRSLGPEIVSLRRALRDARARSTLEAAVIDAAVEKRRQDDLEMQWALRKIEHGVYQVTDHVAANAAFNAAVDALNAVRGKA